MRTVSRGICLVCEKIVPCRLDGKTYVHGRTKLSGGFWTAGCKGSRGPALEPPAAQEETT